MPLSPSRPKIRFFFQDITVSLIHRSNLKKAIEDIFKKEGKKLFAINYIFCTDKALLEINRQFLSHDFYTDIISFELSESEAAQGEIYISIERVRDNAKKLSISFKQELHRVIFHGALHLCGYRDKNLHEVLKMRQKEDFYLKNYFKS